MKVYSSTYMYVSVGTTNTALLPFQSDLCVACVRGGLHIVSLKQLLVEVLHWTSYLGNRHCPKIAIGQRPHVSPCAAERREEIRGKDISRQSQGRIPAECSVNGELKGYRRTMEEMLSGA